MREWLVAGALVEAPAGVLLVRNRRHGGESDWSTPGGVIDANDASILAGLTREVEEETGLRVASWEGPIYEVHVVAADLGWTLRVEVHRALVYEGELCVDDPDGVVVEAVFLSPAECTARLVPGAPWVHEPLSEWLLDPWGPGSARRFRYDVRGTSREELDVLRAEP